jgi:hypothetical protein
MEENRMISRQRQPDRTETTTYHGTIDVSRPTTQEMSVVVPEGGPIPTGRTSHDLAQGLGPLGIPRHEAEMYIALALRGPSTAREAIQESGLDRATGYRVLAHLQSRGLVSSDGRWPRTYAPLPLKQLFDRLGSLVRDEAETQQKLKELYLGVAGIADPSMVGGGNGFPSMPGRLSVPMPVPDGHLQLFAGTTSPIEQLGRVLRTARTSIDASVRPRSLSAEGRSVLARHLGRALQRRVKLRLVIDETAGDRRFLGMVLRECATTPSCLEVRCYVPHFTHLYSVDSTFALRYVGYPAPSHRGQEASISAFEPSFVRSQTDRFQTIWTGAVPLTV